MNNVKLLLPFAALLAAALVPLSAYADNASASAIPPEDVLSGPPPAFSSSAADPDGDWVAYDVTPASSSDSEADEAAVSSVPLEEDDADSMPESTAAPTIWDKPFEEYTPAEGYLFLLFVLAVSCIAFKLFRRGF